MAQELEERDSDSGAAEEGQPSASAGGGAAPVSGHLEGFALDPSSGYLYSR